MAIIFLDYLYWHYAVAPFAILQIMRNYSIANWHRFLIIRHLETLFAPWHRQNPSDFGKRERNFSDKILDSMADLYIRLIAACIRLFIIFGGLLTQLLVFITFMVLYVIWLAWPVISIYMIIKGFKMI